MSLRTPSFYAPQGFRSARIRMDLPEKLSLPRDRTLKYSTSDEHKHMRPYLLEKWPWWLQVLNI